MVLSGNFTFQELTDAINKWERTNGPASLMIKAMAELVELEHCQRSPMISATGFRDPELPKEGTRTSIARVRRAGDGQSVVLKILKNGNADP